MYFSSCGVICPTLVFLSDFGFPQGHLFGARTEKLYFRANYWPISLVPTRKKEAGQITPGIYFLLLERPSGEISVGHSGMEKLF